MTLITKNFKVFCPTKNITEDDNGTLYIEGIANTGQPDLVGDIITETALKQIVAQAPQRNLHYNHKDGKKDLLGRIKESELRPEGAWIKTRILNEQKDWLKSYMEQEIVFGQSISGCCTYEEGSYDNIVSWDLTEVSLTDTPCDPATLGTVAISKSFDDLLVTLKNKKEKIKENDKMAEDTLSKDDVIQIVNDAFSEMNEGLLEEIREELSKEYEVKLNELNERINTLEEKVNEPPKDPDNNPSDGNDNGNDGSGKNTSNDPDKAFEEALEKAVQEETEKRVNQILKSITKGVNSRYDSKKHIKNDSTPGNEKTYTTSEIAKML